MRAAITLHCLLQIPLHISLSLYAIISLHLPENGQQIADGKDNGQESADPEDKV